MDVGQLNHQIAQVLENFQRCGLSRIHRTATDSLPEAVVEAVEQLGTTPAPAAPPPARPTPVAPRVADPKVETPKVSSPPADTPAEEQLVVTPAERPKKKPVAEPLQTEPGTWELPVLDTPTRQKAFGELNSRVAACRLCPEIVSYRQQTVFGSGDLNPRVCFVGEAPGADEDRSGELTAGEAGKLLTKIIGAMKLSPDDVYILNALKCRPPQNRTPIPEEIDNCRSYIQTQIDVLQPEFIVCLGAVAVRSVLNDSSPVGQLRGRMHHYRGARVVVTYHPSYLLRQESAKRMVWDDMQMLMGEMGLK